MRTRHPFRRLAVALLATLALMSAPRSASAATPAPLTGVRLAPATPGAVRFTVLVPEPSFVRTDHDLRHDDLRIDGFTSVGTPGRPALPTRVVLVAVPPLGEVRLTAVASDVRVREDVTLAPQPAEDREGHVVRVARDLAAYGEAGTAVPA
ncbi:MAG: Propeptide, partial [Candidatus Eisenbacteria bacterium]